MDIGIVGGGILGLTLGFRLAGQGHRVEIFESAPQLGGLATWHDYGPFVWDRFYHCILPQDGHLLALLGDLGLAADLRWTRTGTGYWAGGRFFDMNGPIDFLRFPLLSWLDKARLGATVLYATRFADPWQLYRVTAQDWLIRLCGRRGYNTFWRPLLKAKFGTYHDQVAAVFIWATLMRLYGARTVAGSGEKLGYVAGGYRRILDRFAERLRGGGATLRVATPVQAIRLAESAGSGMPRCEIDYLPADAESLRTATFDQVFFTGPTGLAERVVDARLRVHVENMARQYPTASCYLGVACLVLALRDPLTSYYVLNIGEEGVALTGVVEMTNLVDRCSQTAGLSLVFLPQYMDSGDARLSDPDDVLRERILGQGLRRVFQRFAADQVVYQGVHRARFVQPLPLVRAAGAGDARDRLPDLQQPFQVFNTSMLTCATLNNNEVVGLVGRFVAQNRAPLT